MPDNLCNSEIPLSDFYSMWFSGRFCKISSEQTITEELMQQNIEFERCIDFLVRMIDKYGEEVLRELEEEKQNKEEKTA